MQRSLPRLVLGGLLVAALSPLGKSVPAAAGPIDPGTGIELPVAAPFAVTVTSLGPTLVRSVRPVRVSYEIRGLNRSTSVRLEAIDVLGRVVRSMSQIASTPRGTMRWNGLDDEGQPVTPGLYTIRLSGIRASAGIGVEARTRIEEADVTAGVVRMERRVEARVVSRVRNAGREVALTFDDCNFRQDWEAILDILARRHLHATFFCLGINVERFPLLARRTVAEGHTVGSHTYSHPDLRFQSADAIAGQLLHTSNVWWSVAEVTPVPYLRPPYGAYDALAREVAGRLGYRNVVMWDVDPSDWASPGAGAIASRVLAKVRPGSIIVLHAVPETAQALVRILRGLAERDLAPVSLDVLLSHGRVVA